ncbi:unnamed protein product [Trichobilharzia szidati]|nr:unnamed protein product [Trichobilharzia szidati]
MDVFVCTVILALLQANLGVHSLSGTQNAQSTQSAVAQVPLQSTSVSNPAMEGIKGASTQGGNKEGHKVKSVSVAVQTPPKFYKPKTLDHITLAFYKTVVKIMERLSVAFEKISNDVEKLKEKLKPHRH